MYSALVARLTPFPVWILATLANGVSDLSAAIRNDALRERIGGWLVWLAENVRFWGCVFRVK